MKTAVRQTSIDAYRLLDLSNLQQQVVEALEILEESCIADLGAYLDWDRSTVSARLYELKKLNAVVYSGKKPSNSTGISADHWRLKHFSDGLF